eukprot:324600_1
MSTPQCNKSLMIITIATLTIGCIISMQMMYKNTTWRYKSDQYTPISGYMNTRQSISNINIPVSTLQSSKINISGNFTFIHIGKCGGASVWHELENHSFVGNFIDLEKVKFNSDIKYVLLIRNPIQRFISAFNWRYKLVIHQHKRAYKGERQLLQKYKTVNNLSESLYDEKGKLLWHFGKPRSYKYIHHIFEDINWYIGGDFLENCNKTKNIIGVITTENIVNDMQYIFGVTLNLHLHNNQERNDKFLSEIGYENLKKYLKKDYECIDKLYKMNVISTKQYDILSI